MSDVNSGDLNDELENGITEVSDKNRVNLGCIIFGAKQMDVLTALCTVQCVELCDKKH
ncbi:hypothetical protein [Gardnerella swidsinskii]|uniref:hypothetical protein n=1 Tax=Gardnerella swidsinskii TaxID=2792979 RepID=UPI001F087365|nr:hypothetical protein [Gardnerella swidsinskii]